MFIATNGANPNDLTTKKWLNAFFKTIDTKGNLVIKSLRLMAELPLLFEMATN